MQPRETSVNGLAVSIAGLRSARSGLATAFKPHDKMSFKARIDLCDELINRVDEIDRNLRRLSLNVRQRTIDDAQVQHQDTESR